MNKGFESYLHEQYRLHPSMRAQDVHKLCYQAVYGAEHLLSDIEAAKKYFTQEFDSIIESSVPLFEEISREVCRVNMAAWKAAGLCGEWLFNMFSATLRESRGSHAQFAEYIEIAKRELPLLDWDTYNVTDNSVHHSEEYRAAEKPAYRIVDRRFVRLIPILQQIDKNTKVIAFDGRAASGKTTAAAMLSVVLGASVVHMDDFFLPPKMRTAERLFSAGGNVHYERFADEVLPKLRLGEGFEYNIFDCSVMKLSGKRLIEKSDICIVEGAYSMHPYFGDYADLKVFFDIDATEQMQRITARNGEQMAEMFEKRWIPLEEKYYREYQIKEKSDIVIK